MSKSATLFLCLLVSLFSSLINAKVIHSERSLYRNIIVDEHQDLRCLKFNVKSSKTSQSCLLKSEPHKLVFNYTKLLFSSLLMIDEPKSVLVIGLGGGTMSNTIHQLYPHAKIDNVEIDPAVITVARNYFGFVENDNVRSIVQDGRIFVKRAALKKQQYDWIILDAFNGDYIPEHLMTKEFFQEIRALLSDKGVLAANTFSVSKLYRHESATYHAVFGDFYNVANRKNSNRIILTNKQTLPTAEQIYSRANKLDDKLAVFGIDIKSIQRDMQSTKNDKDWSVDTKVLTDQYSPANLLNL
jgi:spermidine synthase